MPMERWNRLKRGWGESFPFLLFPRLVGIICVVQPAPVCWNHYMFKGCYIMSNSNGCTSLWTHFWNYELDVANILRCAIQYPHFWDVTHCEFTKWVAASSQDRDATCLPFQDWRRAPALGPVQHTVTARSDTDVKTGVAVPLDRRAFLYQTGISRNICNLTRYNTPTEADYRHLGSVCLQRLLPGWVKLRPVTLSPPRLDAPYYDCTTLKGDTGFCPGLLTRTPIF